MDLPSYNELPVFEKTGERHAWGVFGAGDQLGTINLLTPERVVAASKLVRTGRVINLSLPLNFPTTLYHGETRSGYTGPSTASSAAGCLSMLRATTKCRPGRSTRK